MKRGVGLALLLVPLLVSPLAVAEQEAAGDALVERVLRETGVEDRPERPQISDYLHHLFRHMLTTSAARGSVTLLARIVQVALWILVGLAVCAVVWLLWVVVRSRRGRAPAPSQSNGATVVDAPAEPSKSAAQWRQEIEACLAGGNFAGAVRATWWWIATATVQGEAQPSWTTEDAARLARHPGIGSLLHRLDRMAFGLNRPDGEQIRSIVNDAERLVA